MTFRGDLRCPETPTILIVEGQTPLRRFVARTLRDAGFVTLEAADAIQGRNLLQTYGDSVVLAIIDIVMQGTSGLDLAVEMEHAHAGIKVLFTSGHISSLIMEGLARRFPEHLLMKPFSERELLARVTGLL
jgi:two-component system, cell cycle sensor histidine kinase and response regulator CckA